MSNSTTTQNDPPPLFPSEAFIGLFAKYRDLVAPTTEAPVALIFGAFMVALAFLVGRDVTLAWGASAMPPVLNAIVLGSTARARKSTVIDDAIEIVAQPLMPSSVRAGEPQSAEIVVGLGSGEGFAEAIADRHWWAPGRNPKKDPPETQTGRRGLFAIHEVGALLEKNERGQAGAMLDFILAAFDARRIWSHRTRSKSDTAALTLTDAVGVFIGASTPAWLVKTLTESMVMLGFANRFLWFAGPVQRALAMRPAIPREQIERFQAEVAATLSAVRGKKVELSPEAARVHAAFYEEERARKLDSDVADAAVARGDLLALRLIILLAIAEGVTVGERRHVEAAWAVIRYSETVVTGLVAQIGERTMREAEARVLAAARRVGARRDGRFRQRDVYQNVKGRNGMDAETFNRCWNALATAGGIVEDSNAPGLFFVAEEVEVTGS